MNQQITIITNNRPCSLSSEDNLNDENRQARKDAEEGNFAHTFRSEEEFTKFMNDLMKHEISITR